MISNCAYLHGPFLYLPSATFIDIFFIPSSRSSVEIPSSCGHKVDPDRFDSEISGKQSLSIVFQTISTILLQLSVLPYLSCQCIP